MAIALPPITTAVVALVLLCSAACMLSEGALRRLAMLPGNTVLGERHLWNIVTAALVETDSIRLALQVVFILVAGVRAEQLAPPSAGRVGWALLTALLVSGTCVSFGSLMMYLSSYNEGYLYKPLWGTGPVAAALAVAAHQVLGDAPIIPTHAPGLSYSLLPLAVVAISGVSQFGVLTSRDFVATCVSLLAAWVYLRWVHAYAPGVVGDTRDEFDFLSMVPNPFRIALRPIVRLLGALLLRLPFFSKASGDGMKTLPAAGDIGGAYGGDVGKAGAAGTVTAATPDPIAERRRERALKALDKKLAELRSSIRAPSGAPASASSPSSLIPASQAANSLGSSNTVGDGDVALETSRADGSEGTAGAVGGV